MLRQPLQMKMFGHQVSPVVDGAVKNNARQRTNSVKTCGCSVSQLQARVIIILMF
jgi:hypothetical protein